MSIFGNPLPYEDNTAASLIRRGGYPPEETYNQKPEVYQCPCCSEFAQAQERERLVRAAKEQKEAERRRLMQLDVFDERAKPVPSTSGKRRQSYRAIAAPVEEPELDPQSDVPAPPATLDELRRARQQQAEANQNPAAKLIVTVHHGENLAGAARDQLSVIVRCGAFEGRTAKVPRGKEALTTWDELFEFPYPNSEEPLEVLVVNDSLPDTNEHLLGGVVVPSNALHDRECGNEELLPVMPEGEMQQAYGTVKEGPLGTIVASWYVSEDGQDRGLDASALEQQHLDETQVCTFVAHRVFQFTDNGSEPFPRGVLCVLRDTDDNCSESVLYTPGSLREPSVSPYFGKEGYHYMPENPSQVMELNTDKKLGHILVCVPKNESAAADDEEELIVVGAVPLDFERLHNKGSAVLLVESKSKEDALWGEIQIEWMNKPAAGNDEPPRQIEPAVQEESLFVTAVRGLNLTDRKGVPVENGHVVVTTEELEGAGTPAPTETDEDGNHVINWNQEIRFIGVKPNEEAVEVTAFSDGRPVSTGRCRIPGEEGNAVVEMHDINTGRQHLGDVLVNYKRLHVEESQAARAIEDAPVADEEQQEADGSGIADEEVEEADEAMYPREDDEPAGAGKEDDEQAHGAAGDDEPEDENPFEEEEEEEAPVAQSRAAPAPEAQPEDEGEEGNPFEEEEELDEADQADQAEETAGQDDQNGEDASAAPEDEEEEFDEEQMYPTEDTAEQQAANDQDGASNADEDPAEQQQSRAVIAEDDEDEDPLEEEEEVDQKEPSEQEEPQQQDDEVVEHEEDEEMYPTEDAAVPAEDEKEPSQPTDSNRAVEEDQYDEEVEEDAGANGLYPTEDPAAPEDEKVESEPVSEHDDVDEEVEEDDKEDGLYPTEDGPAESQARAAPEQLAEQPDSENQGDDTYPTEDGAGAADEDAQASSKSSHDDAKAGEEEAADEEQEEDIADDGMYPTEDAPVNEAESDADKYEQDGDEDEADDTKARDLPDDAAAAGGDDQMYPTEDAPAGDAADATNAGSDADTDMAPRNTTSRSPRAHPSWKRKPSADSTKYPGYQKPWYPAGNAGNENHLPYEKTQLASKSQESIKELEARRARLAEESQRRGSSPRLSDDEL